MVNDSKGSWEFLRIATPVLTTLGLFIIGIVGSNLGGHIDRMETSLTGQISKLDDKVFKHLTNDEIHIPRGTIVDKSQFELVNQMRVAQIQDIKVDICDLKTLVLEVRQEARDGKRTK